MTIIVIPAPIGRVATFGRQDIGHGKILFLELAQLENPLGSELVGKERPLRYVHDAVGEAVAL